MMDFELNPPHGLGPLRLGAGRMEAERVLREWGEPIAFSRGAAFLGTAAPGWVVQREEATVFVGCDEAGIVTYVELATTGYGTVGTDRVTFRGVDVFASPAAEVISALEDMGLRVEEEEEEATTSTVRDLVLSLWRDGGPVDDTGQPAFFETVLIARPGYYH